MLEWPFIVGNLRHICAILMLSHQRLAVPHLGGGWIDTSFDRFVSNIRPFVYLWTETSSIFELIKINGRRNKSVYILAQRGWTFDITSAVQCADGVTQNHKWHRSDGPLTSVDCDVCCSLACSSLRCRFIKNERTSRWLLYAVVLNFISQFSHGVPWCLCALAGAWPRTSSY